MTLYRLPPRGKQLRGGEFITSKDPGATVITGEAGIRYYQLRARTAALKLELTGMTRRGQSVYSICKQVYALTGNRTSVYEQMVALCDKTLKSHQEKSNEPLPHQEP